MGSVLSRVSIRKDDEAISETESIMKK